MEQGRKQDHSPRLQKSRLWPGQGSAWKNPMSYSLGKKRVPGELVDFQRSPPASSRLVHPNRQEIKQKQQEACTHGRGDLTELKHYKEAYKRRNLEQVTQEE